MTRFLEDLPSRLVDYRLHVLCHDNPQIKRDRGDLQDMAALSIAVAYCDVVVTEKHWADMITRTGLDAQFNTRVIGNLKALPTILAASSAD